MSQENLKEVEIITQRIDDQFLEKESKKIQQKSNQDKLDQEKNISSNQQLHSPKENGLQSKEGEKQSNPDQNEINQSKRHSTHGEARKSNAGHLNQHIGQNHHDEQEKAQGEEEQVDIFDVPEQKPVIRHPKILDFIESSRFQIYITIVTVYALFADDIRVMATTLPADTYFDVFTSIALASFILEIALTIVAKDDYLWGFFFWLDAISTISLILDIQAVSIAIFYSGAGNKTAQLAKAGKASRVGTRAGRIVRLVRLIRIVKLYKAASEEKKDDDDIDTALKKYLEQKEKKKKIHPSEGQSNPNDTNRKDEEGPQQVQAQQKQVDDKPKKQGVFKESRVSKRLSDLTTRRVIIIVLMLLFIMPLFSSDYYFDSPTAIDFAMVNFKTMAESAATYPQLAAFFSYIIEIHSGSYINSPMVYFKTPFPDLKFEDPVFKYLRHDEKQLSTYPMDTAKFITEHSNETALITYFNNLDVESQDDEDIQVYGSLNVRSTNIIVAGLSLGRTIFVCFVLTMGALAFTNDANELALGPIERMINKVNKIARNPISAKDQELIKEQGGEDQYETVIIENAIIKIGSLLALGFGDAGSEIIGSNMAKNGDVDPMIPGKKKCAIYGFCDIRNFTDATEQLQEDVMLFVNNIGDIVHSIVDRFGGAANKNIGDAFLMVWKIDKNQYKIDDATNQITYIDPRYIEILCDFAVLSFMKIQAKLNREPKILKYREDQRLLSRLAGYKVKMGYGLHIGWGIEGAIGSEFKIDASYLSPNVNMSSKLEEKSKQYGTPLLISEALYSLCTQEMKRYLRQVDRIKEKGVDPFGLFTVDMYVDNLPPSKDASSYQELGISKKARMEIEKFKKLDMLDYLKHDEEEVEWSAEDYITQNKDMKYIMDRWDEEFIALYNEGFQFYISGDWQQAKSKFDQCRKTHPDDGPIQNLMDVMSETNFKAPSDWAGYKEYSH